MDETMSKDYVVTSIPLLQFTIVGDAEPSAQLIILRRETEMEPQQ